MNKINHIKEIVYKEGKKTIKATDIKYILICFSKYYNEINKTKSNLSSSNLLDSFFKESMHNKLPKEQKSKIDKFFPLRN